MTFRGIRADEMRSRFFVQGMQQAPAWDYLEPFQTVACSLPATLGFADRRT